MARSQTGYLKLDQDKMSQVLEDAWACLCLQETGFGACSPNEGAVVITVPQRVLVSPNSQRVLVSILKSADQ